ncbi:MAG: phage scaffolding protein [Anaerolineaceae bacterium]|nr:phage scaffolding protein [Anaerolineaceae bacterium]
MKREDLKALELSDEAIDQIMKLHGKDVEDHKASLAQAQQTIGDLQDQVKEAGETIEGFKKLDVDGIKAAADDWKLKAEQAETQANEKIAKLKFDHALDSELTGAKAKNAKAVHALLDMNALKLNEADGSIIGLKDQLEKIKADNDYLFESDTPTPTIVSGASKTQIAEDKVVSAARQAAGLNTDPGKDK